MLVETGKVRTDVACPLMLPSAYRAEEALTPAVVWMANLASDGETLKT